MQTAESEALLTATTRAIEETPAEHRFTAEDIRHLHRTWLREIYPWAGEYRSVNLSVGGFMFASASEVPRLMQELEGGPLKIYTPCVFADIDRQAEALAVTHAELVLIHPFREGNGRCARLLATLMALQAGLPVLDFRGIRGRERARYITAVQAALASDYEPMKAVFLKVIKRSMRLSTAAP
jgi:cell filamentation protein